MLLPREIYRVNHIIVDVEEFTVNEIAAILQDIPRAGIENYVTELVTAGWLVVTAPLRVTTRYKLADLDAKLHLLKINIAAIKADHEEKK